jgi:hypothetical protein
LLDNNARVFGEGVRPGGDITEVGVRMVELGGRLGRRSGSAEHEQGKGELRREPGQQVVRRRAEVGGDKALT